MERDDNTEFLKKLFKQSRFLFFDRDVNNYVLIYSVQFAAKEFRPIINDITQKVVEVIFGRNSLEHQFKFNSFKVQWTNEQIINDLKERFELDYLYQII